MLLELGAFPAVGAIVEGNMSDPGRRAGAHETALHPMLCPSKTSASQEPSSVDDNYSIISYKRMKTVEIYNDTHF